MTIPPLVVRIRASSTVFVKASSLVNLDLAGILVLARAGIRPCVSADANGFLKMRKFTTGYSTNRLTRVPGFSESPVLFVQLHESGSCSRGQVIQAAEVREVGCAIEATVAS